MRSNRTPAVLALLALLSSCKDAAGPAPVEQAPLATVTASGPDTFQGTWDGAVFGCTYSMRVTAGGPPGALAHWGSGAVSVSTTSVPVQTHFDTLSVGEVRGVFGASTIRTGEAQSGVLNSGFQFPVANAANALRGAHTATWVFTYSVGTQKSAVTYQARCDAPPAPPPLPLLAGRYVLTTINDLPLPAYDIVADTFTFHPDTTYSIVGATGGRDAATRSTPRQRYAIVAHDTVDLPTLFPGVGGGRFHRSGTTLLHQTGSGQMAWRFDQVGTTPNLPPPPRIVVSRDTVRFSAVRGGALPDSQVVQVTSSTSRQIGRIISGSCLGTIAPNGLCVSRWGSASTTAATEVSTPTSLTFRILTTDLPPGTYRGAAGLQTPSAVNSPYEIPVVYTVTAP